MGYIGSLLLGLVIGAASVAGYMLSLPIHASKTAVAQDVVIDIAPRPEAKVDTATQTATQPSARAARMPDETRAAKTATSDVPKAPKPVPIASGTKTAALEDIQKEQPTAMADNATPDTDERVRQSASETAAAPVSEPQDDDEPAQAKSEHQPGDVMIFPGLSIAAPPPSPDRIAALSRRSIVDKPEPTAIPTPKRAAAPKTGNPPATEEKTAEQGPQSVVQVAAPETETANALPPNIEKADLVLPRPHPRRKRPRQ